MDRQGTVPVKGGFSVVFSRFGNRGPLKKSHPTSGHVAHSSNRLESNKTFLGKKRTQQKMLTVITNLSKLALLGGFGGRSSNTRTMRKNKIEQNAANRTLRKLTCEVTSETAESEAFPHFSSLQCWGKDPLKVLFCGEIISRKVFTGPFMTTGGMRNPKATPNWFPKTPKLNIWN